MGFASTAQDWLIRSGLAALAAVGLWILGSWLFRTWAGDDSSQQSAAALSASAAASHRARARDVCERTRARIQTGGSVTPADVDGWLVELLLLRRPGDPAILEDPGLDSLLQPPASRGGRKLASDTVRELAELNGADTVVTVTDATLPAGESGGAARPGLRLEFGGRYVAAYFGTETRNAYFRLAALFAERLDAAQAALYARCRHEDEHYLGSWFQGTSAADALTALFVGMGLAARAPHVSPPALRGLTPNIGDTLTRIEQATKSVSIPDLAAALAPSGGTVLGRRGQRITVVFPFSDGNRASRASRASARELGLLEPHAP